MNTGEGIGRTILGGKYRITQEIGRGGMGVVYKGIQSSLGRSVAIKVLPAQLAQDLEFVNRFRREAEVLARLNHPSIVTIHDLDVEGADHFIVMECVDGHDLSTLLGAGKTMPIYMAVSIAIQTAEALDAAHRCGVVHRDVKPQNILIEEITGRVKVADFGVAAMADATSLTRTGSVIGTPKYMAPEQIKGMQATSASDVYSLGAVLYEMLAGRAPYVGETAMSIAYQHIEGTLPPLGGLAPDAPPALVKIVERALEKQPERRFASAGEMAKALRALQLEESAPGEGSAPGTDRRRFGRGVAIAGAVAVTVIAAVFVAQMIRGRGEEIPRSGTSSTVIQKDVSTNESAEAPVSPAATPTPQTVERSGAAGIQPAPTTPGSEGSKTASKAVGQEREAAVRTAQPSGDEGKTASSPISSPAVSPGAPPAGQETESPAVQVQPPQAPVQPARADRAVYDNAQAAFRAANYAAALTGYRSYLQGNPDPELAADAQHGVAECLYNLGNYATAIAEYQKAADAYPSSKWADDSSYAIAWCYEKQRDYASAIRSYLSFVARYPSADLAAEAQYRAARCRFDQADYAGALPAYRMAIQNYPRGAFCDVSQYAIGECYYRQGDFVNAAAEYAKVIQSYPSSQWADDAQLSIGWSFLKQKDYSRALQEFSLVERAYPRSDQVPTAEVQAARCHLALGDRIAAESGLREVMQRFPGSKAAAEAQETLGSIR